MSDGTAHDTDRSDKKGFGQWIRLLLAQVPGPAMHGMSAEVAMLQVKGRAEDYRGEPQSQRTQTQGKGNANLRGRTKAQKQETDRARGRFRTNQIRLALQALPTQR